METETKKNTHPTCTQMGRWRLWQLIVPYEKLFIMSLLCMIDFGICVFFGIGVCVLAQGVVGGG